MGCFNCDGRDHMAIDCTRPNNYAQAGSRKLEYHQNNRSLNSVHVILAHLCKQLDHETIIPEDETEGPDAYVYIFQSIVGGPNFDDTVVNYSAPALSQSEDEHLNVF